MTREQEFFLQVLSDYLNGRATNPPEGLDWPQIAKYAKSHQVEGVFYYQCKEYLENCEKLGDILDRFSKAYAAATFYYFNNIQAFNELAEIYRRESVDFFAVKGLEVAALYPVPAIRTMGDIDIVMHTESIRKVHEPMTSAGYIYEPGDYEQHWHKGNVNLELHDTLASTWTENIKKRRDFFNLCWDYVESDGDRLHLSWDFHFVFLVEHLMIHFVNHGIGFRQFMDVAIVIKTKKLNRERILNDLEAIGLITFAKKVMVYCEKWFGISLPYFMEDIDEEEFRYSTDWVFSNGVFGFQNRDHNINSMGRSRDKINAPKALRPIIQAAQKVFRPYREMVRLPYCSFLAGRRFLLPFAWIYRIFYVAIHKRGNITAERKLVFGSGKVLNERETFLKQWGL